MEQVVLVDKNDNEIGVEEKIKAHENGGKLHRAFSIFIFNSRGELLLQLRSIKKYHFGGLWTNTCCSHPRPGESLEHAAHRKLKQEFGFDTKLEKKFSFIYQADFDNGLSEHEFDYVFVGIFDGKPKPNPEEIDDWKWVNIEELKKDIKENPKKFTVWFRIAFERLMHI